MSLEIYFEVVQPCVVFDANITHNLTSMADAAGIYKHLWRPNEIGISKARELIEPLREGLAKLKHDSVYYRQFDAPNGWGKYEHFIEFVQAVLQAAEANPDATVRVSR